MYGPIRLDLKLVKQVLKGAPLPLNLVTRGDENAPRDVPGLGCLGGPFRQLWVQPGVFTVEG